MNDIDNVQLGKVSVWCAAQCGLEPHMARYKNFDIKRADDREIVRERFGVGTTCHEDLKTFIAYTRECTTDGETIAEAEIACITAIYETRDENTKD